MSKKTETTDNLEENLFEGFSFLNEQVPKGASKKKNKESTETKSSDVNLAGDDELSEDDIKALEEAAEAIKSKKPISKKNTDEEIETKKETSDNDVEDSNEFEGFAKFLAEEGVIDLEEDVQIKSEKDLVKVVDNTIKKGIESYKSSKPEDVQKFIEFVDNGGKPSDFHKYYYSDASFEDFDITDLDNKKYVIREALKLEDYTDEEIEEELTLYEDTDKIDKKAETFLKKLQKVEKANRELLVESQKAYAKEQEAKRLEEWDAFKKGLFEKETIGGFKMTPKMKEDTWSYMTKIVDKKTGETQYQKDSKENPDARYLFAYLLKNKWDKSALEKQVETKQVSKLKEKLSNYTDTRQKLKSPVKDNKQTEEGENPFSAFKKILS